MAKSNTSTPQGTVTSNGSSLTTHHASPYGGIADPIMVNQLRELATNVALARQEMFARFSDPRRDIDQECGYPSGITFSPEQYRDLYDKFEIATRVNEVMPKECFQVSPTLYEDEEDEATEFENAWDALEVNVGGLPSWHQDEEGSSLWQYILRADIVSGIGSFGIILLGINDGKPLHEPIDAVMKGLKPSQPSKDISGVSTQGQSPQTKDIYGGDLQPNPEQQHLPVPDTTLLGTDAQYFQVQFTPAQDADSGTEEGKTELLFLRVFDESLVQVVQYEANIYNPRFGQPVMYLVTLNDPRQPHTGVGLPLATLRVHWSRIIHIADNLGSSEIFGVPRSRPVLRRLLDLQKIYGASGEGYWQSCFMGLSFETHPQLGGDVIVDEDRMRTAVENYKNSLQRFLAGVGGSWKTLAPTVVDPTPHIDKHIEAICIQLGIPVRVFKGSERGELASSQDDSSWNDRLKHRQNFYITPRIIVPFIDRLILIGVLPEPSPKSESQVQNRLKPGWKISKRYSSGWLVVNEEAPPDSKPKDKAKFVAKKGYSIEWPDLDSLSDKDKAGIFLQITQALAAYVSGGVEALIPPQQYLSHVGKGFFTDEEVKTMLEAAVQHLEDSYPDSQDMDSDKGIQPGHPPAPPEPPPPPLTPMVAKPGDKLVHPQTGQPVSASKPLVQPPPQPGQKGSAATPPTANEADTDAEFYAKVRAEIEGII